MSVTLAVFSLLTMSVQQPPVTQQQLPPPTAQQAPPTTPAVPRPAQGTVPGTATPPVVQDPYEFTSEVGAFLIVVKADKAAAFDAAMAKLKAALSAPTAPAARKQQALGWRVLKSSEPATGVKAATATEPASAGTLAYLWIIDPAVKKLNYNPIEIMRELAPNDLQGVHDQLTESVVSITRISMKELLRMGSGG